MAQNTNTPTLEATHREEPTDEELRLMSRRYALRLLGGAGLAVIAACATDGVVASTTASATGTSTSAAGTTATTTFGGAGTCVLFPEETEGPYPLDLSGDEEFFRRDITEASGQATFQTIYPGWYQGRITPCSFPGVPRLGAGRHVSNRLPRGGHR